MSENEKELLKKSINGDVEAFEKLISRYQKKVFNIALRMVGNYDDAGELAQEALIRVFKSIKNFKEEASFSTWIYRITTNVCLDSIRKNKNKKVLYLDEDIRHEDGEEKRQVEDFRPSLEARVEINEMKKAVNECICMLPEDFRTVIILRDIQGFSYDEISRVIKCPEGTVKSRINRARQALKELLKTKKELFGIDYVK